MAMFIDVLKKLPWLLTFQIHNLMWNPVNILPTEGAVLVYIQKKEQSPVQITKYVKKKMQTRG